jgi:streptogramin lyase
MTELETTAPVTTTARDAEASRATSVGSLHALTARLGWSEGDAWTAGIGLTLALVLAVTTIPAALRDRPATFAGGRAPAAAPAVPPVVGDAPPPAADPSVGDLPLGPLAVPQLPPTLDPFTPPGVPSGGTDGMGPADDTPPSSPAVDRMPLPANAVALFAPVPGGAPGAVTTTPDGRVHAATGAPPDESKAASQLLSFDASGALRDSVPVPGQPAERTMGVTALATAPDGTLLATDAATDRVLVYDPRLAKWSVRAELPDLPPCLLPVRTGCQPGLLDTAPLPRGAVVDSDGTAFVADAGQGIVFRLPPGKAPEVFFSSAEVMGENGLAGLDLDGDGDLVAAVTQVAGPLAPESAGTVITIERQEDGSAGAFAVLAAFQPGEHPVDVAVGASGNTYVAVRGEAALVVLDPDGREQLRITDAALGSPTAVHLTSGRLFVTSAEPQPVVLQIGTDDKSVPAGQSPRGPSTRAVGS